MRILVADDHAIVRRGIREILSEAFPEAHFGEARNAAEVFALLSSGPWDLLTLDVSMPGRNGVQLLREIKRLVPKVPKLVVSMHPENQFAVGAFKAGAAGYLTKDTVDVELVRAARKVLAGELYVSAALGERLAANFSNSGKASGNDSLSQREYDVIRLLAGGRTVKEIASDLNLSVKTVSTYRVRLMAKLNFKNNAEIIRYAIVNNLVA